MNEDLEECRRRLPLYELLRALGYGDYEVGKRIRCPFKERHKHSDKDPSFIIRFNPQTGRYHGKCYAICGAIDEIKLIQGHFSLTTFVDALKQYCELAGVKSSVEVLPDWDVCVDALSVAIHCCRLHSKKWFYQPRGAKAWPFIIGDSPAQGT
jgi:hypothetical protein